MEVSTEQKWTSVKYNRKNKSKKHKRQDVSNKQNWRLGSHQKPNTIAYLPKKLSYELNNILRNFYLHIRNVDGEKYKTSSLENFCHSLNH